MIQSLTGKLRSIYFSLSGQVTLVLVVMIVAMSTLISISMVLLVRSQFERQGTELIQQGNRTVQTLLGAHASVLSNTAALIAQRPTLLTLIDEQDTDGMGSYLETLRAGSGLDALIVCRADMEPAAQVGIPIPGAPCRQTRPDSVYLPDSRSSGWMLAAQAVEENPNGFFVVAGTVLDAGFARRIRDLSELEIVFLIEGKGIASSFETGEPAWESLTVAPGETGRLDGPEKPYLALRDRFADTELETLVFFSAAELTQAQWGLIQLVLSGIFGVALLSAGLAIYLARRISRPMERLHAAAMRLRMGDLTTPIATGSRVRSIAQVSSALEDARIALHHSLTALRQEKAWVDHLIESVSEGIVIQDRQGRVTFFSQGAERITGWKQEEVIGKNIDQVFPAAGENSSFSESLSRAEGKRAVVPVSFQGRLAALSVTDAKLSSSEAGRSGTALVFRDVSDEESLRRLLGDFLANITHEFRTPLSALAASIELLLGQIGSLSQEETKELLVSLQLGVLNLQTLIDNLLEGASIEAGRFRVQPHPADLNQIVSEASDLIRPLADKYGQRLTVKLPDALPFVQVDPRRTNQVLVNLLSNAIKWSPSGSDLTIIVQKCEKEVMVSVGDQGPGIPPEQKAHLFNRFVHLRLENQRTESGAGLGLSVVKAIVEAQGGQVSVADREGGGALFSFTLPVAEEQA